jgi:GGDEF domain-containing protein
VLSTTCRASDHVARIDEHTFAVLVVEADHTKSPRVQQRLSSALHSAGIDAFVGVAVRRPGDEGGGLTAAFERALAYQEGSARARELEARSALLQED